MRIIDADAMMERLKAWDTNDAIDKALYNFALNRVLEAPTVEPERKTGQWISKPGVYGVRYCSECGYELHLNGTNFCPSCGSHNGGEKEIRNVKA